MRAGDPATLVPGEKYKTVQSPVESPRKLGTAGGRTCPSPSSLLTTPHRHSGTVSFAQCMSVNSEASGARRRVGLWNQCLFSPAVCSWPSCLLIVAFLLCLEGQLCRPRDGKCQVMGEA